MPETLRGELLDFQIRTADNWGTGILQTKHDGGRIKLVGKVVGAVTGDTVQIDGDFEDHPKYGRRLKVKSCTVLLPSDVSGVVSWLAAKLPQISRRRAEELVGKYGVAKLWELLEASDVAELTSIDGITPERALLIVQAYHASKGDRDRMVQLRTWGLTDGQIGRVVQMWGKDAEEELKRNPYALISDVDGFGWERADVIARKMGLSLESPSRLAAGLMHVMREATQAGNCFVSSGKLVALTLTKTCKVGNEPAMRAALKDLVESDKLARFRAYIYIPRVDRAEHKAAAFVADRMASAALAAVAAAKGRAA